MTTIALASDHRGYKLKENLIKFLEKMDYDIIDFGTSSCEKSVDYPDFAASVCDWMKDHKDGIGILICANGIGMSIAANRNKHVRGALLYSEDVSKMSREHNDVNCAILGADSFSEAKQKKMLKIFLETKALNDTKYKLRVKKIS